MRTPSYLFAIVVFFIGIFSFVSSGLARDLESNVIVLMDFSNSYFTPDRVKKEIPRNINTLAGLIASKADGPKKPSLIQVLPIHSKSETSGAVCEFRIQRKKLVGRKDKDCGAVDEDFCSDSIEEFESYLKEDCVERIVKNKVDDQTDISGALALASQLGLSQTDKAKYLVIFSDMMEYRTADNPFSKIDLSGFNILVVCGGFINNEDNTPKLCMNEQEDWRARFEGLGAQKVYYVNERGRWTSKIGKEFFEND
ncbi:hypothetical protein [Porticoccus sp. Uisw_050_02]|uniref:hypothetical protein n=1 Tax=Porticoccus sp. Uisw_050_02 TaxID=3230978 RepID=UPI0039ED5D8F